MERVVALAGTGVTCCAMCVVGGARGLSRRLWGVWRCSGDVLGCSVALLAPVAVGNSVGPTACMQAVTADRVSNRNGAGDCCWGCRRSPLVI